MDRAAQFAPFAALTGHSDAIKETARLTMGKLILSEEEKLRLNEMLVFALKNNDREFSFLYFSPDEKKQGGKYITSTGRVKKIDEETKSIVLSNKTEIKLDDIIEIEEKQNGGSSSKML